MDMMNSDVAQEGMGREKRKVGDLETNSSSHLEMHSDNKYGSSDIDDALDEGSSDCDSGGKRMYDGDGQSELAQQDRKKSARGNYRCSKCNQPKKGHICPYQPRYRLRDGSEDLPDTFDKQCQAELDPDMTVRQLDLQIQGYPESYLPMSHPPILLAPQAPAVPHGPNITPSTSQMPPMIHHLQPNIASLPPHISHISPGGQFIPQNSPHNAHSHGQIMFSHTGSAMTR